MQGIYAPTICLYKEKVRLTKLHAGFANTEEKFRQLMTGYTASSQKLTQTKKKPVEENKSKQISQIFQKPKNRTQRFIDFCVKFLSTLEG